MGRPKLSDFYSLSLVFKLTAKIKLALSTCIIFRGRIASGVGALVCYFSPLIYASMKGYTDIVHLLLSQPGIEINYKNGKQSPLIWASANGHVEIVQQLLSQPGIEINYKESEKYFYY